MARGPATFKQRDVTAAVRAVRAAGVDIARIKVAKGGTIQIDTGKPEVKPEGENDLDRELAEWAGHGED